MKKIILIVAVATMIAGVVFVACQKEITKTDKKEVIKQGVKQQKMGNFPMEEFPNVLYSPDGVNFFDENGEEILGIRVDFEEANRKADIGINENGHEYIIVFEGEGDNCGNAIIWNDETGMSWEALYAICSDGRIIIEANPEEPINEVPNVLYSHDGVNFFDENGEIVTGIEVIYGEICGTADFVTSEGGNQHITECTGPGTNCGEALIIHDSGFHQAAIYAIREDGTIITQPREFC